MGAAAAEDAAGALDPQFVVVGQRREAALVEEVQVAAEPDRGVDHARPGVGGPRRPEAVADDPLRAGGGEDRHQAVEVVAGHLVEGGLGHRREVERLRPGLGVEEVGPLRRAEPPLAHEVGDHAVVVAVAHLLADGERQAAGGGQLDQFDRLPEVVGDRFGDEGVQPGRERGPGQPVVQLGRRVDDRRVGRDRRQGRVEVGEARGLRQGELVAGGGAGLRPGVDHGGGDEPVGGGQRLEHLAGDAAHADDDAADGGGTGHDDSCR